jgi:major intracellular serine protease
VNRLISIALTVAAALSGVGRTADPPAVAPAEKAPPEIVLPPEPISDVEKFDKTVMRARDVPYHVALVKAPEAWAKNPAAKGKGMRVGVVDTGCQVDHPGFDGMVKGGYNAITKKAGLDQVRDGNNHGTHCAGIVHSILPEAELYIGKGLSDRGSGSVADLAHAIDYLATEFRCDVISCSFGGPERDTYLPAAIKRANDLGCVVVCAAGNDGGPNDTEGYPGRYPESISVAACDSSRKLASFSSWGPNVFTADPGVEVWSLLPGTREGKMSGTSMACPVEAAKVASWIASNGVPKTSQRRDKYVLAAKGAMPFKERTNSRGFGLYELDKITGDPKTPPPPITPPPGDKVYTLDVAKLKADGYTAVRIDFGVGGVQPPMVMPDVGGGAGMKILTADGNTPPAAAPVPTYHGFNPVPQWAPPPVVYQTMPQCPAGGCPPAQQPPLLFPRLRGWR